MVGQKDDERKTSFLFDWVVVVVLDIQKRVHESEYPDFVVVLCRLIQILNPARNSNSWHFGVAGIVGFLMWEYFF